MALEYILIRFAGLILCLCGLVLPASAIEMCVPGKQRSPAETCVVDGDTLWLDGINIRLQSFDTPEPYSNICGGAAERALAAQASAMLLHLLNTRKWTIEYFGLDRTGRRRLATIWIDGIDVGDMLIDAGLARRWPKGDEFWCSDIAN